MELGKGQFGWPKYLFTLSSSGCMELTLELNERKWPDLPRLAEMWDENLDAFLTYPSIMVLGGEIDGLLND